MPGLSEIHHFTLQIQPSKDADHDQIDQTTRELKLELEELNIGRIDLEKSDQPLPGTKSAEAITLGALAVAVLPAALPKLIDYLQAWTLRSEGRSVKIKSQVGEKTIELEYSPKGISNQDLKELITLLTENMDPKVKDKEQPPDKETE